MQSRIKMLEKVVRIDVPPERKRIRFQFPAAPKSGRLVLELRQARKAYGAKVVLDDVDLHVERGDRIALVGHNGAGKSTLMRLLSGAEAPDRGEHILGHEVVMQYFAQDEATRLDPALTVYETLAAGSPNQMIPPSGTSSAGSCSRVTTSTRRRACCRAASGRAWRWPGCCCGPRTRSCSTSRPTTSTSTRRRCCSTRSPTTAAR